MVVVVNDRKNAFAFRFCWGSDCGFGFGKGVDTKGVFLFQFDNESRVSEEEKGRTLATHLSPLIPQSSQISLDMPYILTKLPNPSLFDLH